MSINQEELNSFLFNPHAFLYESYDHEKAVELFKATEEGKTEVYNFTNPDAIPDRIKEQCKVLRIGKLRAIFFSPIGGIRKMFIGNRRARNFSLWDMGIIVKPILYSNCDPYNLIGRGFAISSTDPILDKLMTPTYKKLILYSKINYESNSVIRKWR